MTKINRCQKRLITYAERRAKYKKDNPDWKKNPEKLARVKSITKKMAAWQNRLYIYRKKYKKLWECADAVCEFMDIPTLWKKWKCDTPELRLARNIFIHHAVINGVSGVWLGEFLGVPDHHLSRARLSFVRSFKTNKTNYDLWKRFRLWLEHSKEDLSQLKNAA